MNTLGKLYEISKEDKIFIELEKKFILKNTSNKSETKNVICDIYLELQDNVETKKCCIELKFFKKENQREPNNRYDYFSDLKNLEEYKKLGIDLCYMVIGTDHEHYVNQDKYSEKTSDFNFRDGKEYRKDSKLVYNTEILWKTNYSIK